MSRPVRFEHYRYLGDKRSQVVHDLDNTGDACALDDLLASEEFLAIAPESLSEARNRGFKPCRHCVVVETADAD
ncbi:MAG TPA: hypothetical protein VF230_03455 [Acidimicrobiales bacterium]